jgi:hypothetical protein
MLRPWRNAVAVVLVANAAFLVLSFAAQLLPQEKLRQRVRDAFAAGDLVEQDYLPFDARRGFHQYNDCNILQMLTNDDDSSAGRAFGPWLRHAEFPVLDACQTLRALVVDERDPESLVSQRYTRYWHGYLPATGFLLMFLSLGGVRLLLLVITHAAALSVVVAGLWRPRFLPLALPIGMLGAFAWGLPYFGQGLSHAYGDAAVMLGITTLLAAPPAIARRERLLPICAAWGSVVAYFDMLTGALPVAAALLLPTAYVVARRADAGGDPLAHLRAALAAVAAFTLGAALSVAITIALAALLARPHDLDLLLGNLRKYTDPVAARSAEHGYVDILRRLFRRGTAMTFGDRSAFRAVLWLSAASWVGAVVVAWIRRTRLALGDLAAFAGGAAGIAVWIAILQSHTFIHAGFMTRILIVPVALGFAALLWQLGSARSSSPRSDLAAGGGRSVAGSARTAAR